MIGRAALALALTLTGAVLTTMAIRDPEDWPREAQAFGAAMFAFLTALAAVACAYLIAGA